MAAMFAFVTARFGFMAAWLSVRLQGWSLWPLYSSTWQQCWFWVVHRLSLERHFFRLRAYGDIAISKSEFLDAILRMFELEEEID